jgi:phosphohistidine phosphatase
MHVYLIQHAQSRSASEDPERHLTNRGIEDIERTGKFFDLLSPHVAHIWHSGKLRAEQTARIVANIIRADNRVTPHEGLDPNDDPHHVAGEITELEQDVVIVGHMPYLSRLAGLLVANDAEWEVIQFQNAGIVCLSDDEDHWLVEWVVTPGILRSEVFR